MDHVSGCVLSTAIMFSRMILCIIEQTMALDHCPRTNGGQGLIIQDAQHPGRTQPGISPLRRFDHTKSPAGQRDDPCEAKAQFQEGYRRPDRSVHPARRACLHPVGYFSTTNGAITEDIVLQYLDKRIANPTGASLWVVWSLSSPGLMDIFSLMKESVFHAENEEPVPGTRAVPVYVEAYPASQK